MEFQAVSGPKFTGPFPLNAGGIAIVCNAGRFSISWAFPEIFAIKVWSGRKLPEILHVFGPEIFLGERPPNFWIGIIKFSHIPTMWQSFRAIGRGSSENEWRNKKKKDTSRVKHKPVRNGCSGRPNNDFQNLQERKRLQWKQKKTHKMCTCKVAMSTNHFS